MYYVFVLYSFFGIFFFLFFLFFVIFGQDIGIQVTFSCVRSRMLSFFLIHLRKYKYHLRAEKILVQLFL